MKGFIKSDLDKEKVIKSSIEIVRSFEELKKCNINYEELNDFMNLFVDLIYDIIKLECIYIGKSNVLFYILKEDIFVIDVNKKIIDEVLMLKNSVNEVVGLDNLKTIMYEKSKAGIETHYVSLEVFKALVICTDYDKTKEQFLSMASLIKEKTNYLINGLNEKIILKSEYEFDLDLFKKKSYC